MSKNQKLKYLYHLKPSKKLRKEWDSVMQFN